MRFIENKNWNYYLLNLTLTLTLVLLTNCKANRFTNSDKPEETPQPSSCSRYSRLSSCPPVLPWDSGEPQTTRTPTPSNSPDSTPSPTPSSSPVAVNLTDCSKKIRGSNTELESLVKHDGEPTVMYPLRYIFMDDKKNGLSCANTAIDATCTDGEFKAMGDLSIPTEDYFTTCDEESISDIKITAKLNIDKTDLIITLEKIDPIFQSRPLKFFAVQGVSVPNANPLAFIYNHSHTSIIQRDNTPNQRLLTEGFFDEPCDPEDSPVQCAKSNDPLVSQKAPNGFAYPITWNTKTYANLLYKVGDTTSKADRIAHIKSMANGLRGDPLWIGLAFDDEPDSNKNLNGLIDDHPATALEKIIAREAGSGVALATNWTEEVTDAVSYYSTNSSLLSYCQSIINGFNANFKSHKAACSIIHYVNAGRTSSAFKALKTCKRVEDYSSSVEGLLTLEQKTKHFFEFNFRNNEHRCEDGVPIPDWSEYDGNESKLYQIIKKATCSALPNLSFGEQTTFKSTAGCP